MSINIPHEVKPIKCFRVYGLPVGSRTDLPQSVVGYRKFGIMTHPASVMAMHKSYFCLHHLRDFKRAITVAADHFKECDDVDLVFMVLMDIIATYLAQNPAASLHEIQKAYLELMNCKNLVGVHRIIVRERLLSFEIEKRKLRGRCRRRKSGSKLLVGGPVRWRGECSALRRVNLSIKRVNIIRKALQNLFYRSKISKAQSKIFCTQKDIEDSCQTECCKHTVRQFQRNLVMCYRDDNLGYCQFEDLNIFPKGCQSMETRSTDDTDVSMSCTSLSTLSDNASMTDETSSPKRSHTAMYHDKSPKNLSLKSIREKFFRDNSSPKLMDWWRKHFRMVKMKIFQVCNMLFININVPFIAVDLFSRVFQNVLATTIEGVRRGIAYIFNQDGYPVVVGEDQNGNRTFTEDDATILFMIAANCLEIALNYHNARVRFDIFSLFYFLVFIDSILTKVDIPGVIESLPSTMLSIVDMRVVTQQKINSGKQYLRRSLKYHHALFRRKLQHLSAELKKNRILHLAKYRLMNCLEQVLLLSHGIFGFNLTLRVAPIIIETTRSLNNKRFREECYTCLDCFDGRKHIYEASPEFYSLRSSTAMEPLRETEAVLREFVDYASVKRSKCSTFVDRTVPSETFIGTKATIGVEKMVKQFRSSSELQKVNTFLTESTEISILLLQLLCCSDYIEILSGNSLYTDPGGDLETSILMSSMSLKFVLDLFIAITDESISNLVTTGRHQASNGEIAAKKEFMDAFKEYFGPYYSNMIDEINCAFYFIMLDIDWVFHKEGVYTDSDYIKHQNLLGKVIDTEQSSSQKLLDEVIDMHHRLYEKIAILMFSGDNTNPRTIECVEAFKGRSKSWNTFDEITIRNTRPEDELSINREIIDIYYPDIRWSRTSFNPYKCIFTPKYFPVAKELIYRVKAALALYYSDQ